VKTKTAGQELGPPFQFLEPGKAAVERHGGRSLQGGLVGEFAHVDAAAVGCAPDSTEAGAFEFGLNGDAGGEAI